MVTSSQTLKKRLQALPHKSGIYIYTDANGLIIYVGKARDLSKRVKQYFSASTAASEKTQLLIAQIADIQTITTESEFDALLLEAKLIREYLPKYNVVSRDDKSPLYIVLTISDELPHVLFVRKTSLQKFKRSDRIFGPFQSGPVVRMLMRELRRIIPYCTQKQRRGEACFYTHIGLCTHCPSVIAKLQSGPERLQMVHLYRMQIRTLANILSGKSLSLLKSLEVDMRRFAMELKFEQAAETKRAYDNLSSLLSYHYDPNLYVQGDSAVEDLFTAETVALREVLLPHFPKLTALKRIECIDISNLQGDCAVGSCVVLTGGRIDTDEYRRFRIKTVRGVNDFAMIAEVLRRRLAHREWPYPDVLIIDGGKGQLESALGVLSQLHINIPAVGLAKRYEEIIIRVGPGWKILRMPHTSKAIHLLQRVRDEAHRFAISYHRKVRRTFMQQGLHFLPV